MTDAIKLADEWQVKTQKEVNRQNSAYDHYGMNNTPEGVDPLGAKMAAELRRLHAQVTALTQGAAERAAPATGNWIAADDVQHLVRELDVALNGKEGAAVQASLCDVVAQVVRASADLGRPVLAAPAAGAVAGPLIDQEATAYNEWFNGEQGTAYEGMWAFGRAAWMARAAQADSGVQEDAARSRGLSSLSVWWAMHEAQWELCGDVVPDDAVILSFMGSGASTQVTAGDLRAALAAKGQKS